MLDAFASCIFLIFTMCILVFPAFRLHGVKPLVHIFSNSPMWQSTPLQIFQERWYLWCKNTRKWNFSVVSVLPFINWYGWLGNKFRHKCCHLFFYNLRTGHSIGVGCICPSLICILLISFDQVTLIDIGLELMQIKCVILVLTLYMNCLFTHKTVRTSLNIGINFSPLRWADIMGFHDPSLDRSKICALFP